MCLYCNMLAVGFYDIKLSWRDLKRSLCRLSVSLMCRLCVPNETEDSQADGPGWEPHSTLPNRAPSDNTKGFLFCR